MGSACRPRGLPPAQPEDPCNEKHGPKPAPQHLAVRRNLLHERQHGERRHTPDVHHPDRECRGHQRPAAADAEEAVVCAGINRRGVVNERVTQERGSDPS